MTRLLALARHFQGTLDRGGVGSSAEIARLGHVSRARLTQIMNLFLLAPDIQEQILFLTPTTAGRDPIGQSQGRLTEKAERKSVGRRDQPSGSGRPR